MRSSWSNGRRAQAPGEHLRQARRPQPHSSGGGAATRHGSVVEDPGMDWKVPERFNFARDVVETRTGPALTYLSAEGERHDLTFAETIGRTAQWANLLARRGV